jgi:hypothetical protein
MKRVSVKAVSGAVLLGLALSIPAMAHAKDGCWALVNDVESAGQLRLRVMHSKGNGDFILNGTRSVIDGSGAIRSFPVAGGAVKMDSFANVTLTETGTSVREDGSVATWATHWHLDLSTADLSGVANAITTVADGTGISSSAATYDAVFEECFDDDDDSSDDDSDDDSSDDDSGDDDSSDDRS